MPKNKGIALVPILIVVALIATLTAGYFFIQNQKFQLSSGVQFATSVTSPTPAPTIKDETANWKTYESKKYGYSIKYPHTILIEEFDNGSSVFLSYDKKNTTDTACSTTHLAINVNSGGLCGSLAYKNSASKIVTSKYNLGEEPTSRYEDYIDDKLVEVRIGEVDLNGNKYEIDYIVTPKHYGKLEKLRLNFDQILSTFKFL